MGSQRAQADDTLPTPGEDPRGWWADTYDGDRFGSRLWLLEGGKVTQDAVLAARQHAEEALAWMVADGVASAVEVTAERLGRNGLALGVTFIRERQPAVALRFERLWE